MPTFPVIRYKLFFIIFLSLLIIKVEQELKGRKDWIKK
jgi:hypothetical protein